MTPQEKLKARKAYLARRQAAWEAEPEHIRRDVDLDAVLFRNSFGEAAEWVVYGEQMVAWEDLPEVNRHNWRAVVGWRYFDQPPEEKEEG